MKTLSLLLALSVLASAPFAGAALAATVPYALPSGPDILQAKLAGPLPTYAPRCDSRGGVPCRVEPGTYQLQTFDAEWRASVRLVTVTAGAPPPPAPDGRVAYALPSGPDILQAKLGGPLPSYAIVCDQVRGRATDTPCRVAPGTYQLQTFDATWRPTRREVVVAGEGSPPSASGTPPAAPTGLAFTRYSTSAGALSWSRPATPGLRYEVRRDGALLGVTDGVSLVDRALAGGRDYLYEVVALGREAGRSAPTRLLARTDGATPAPTPSPLPAPPADTVPAATLPTLGADGRVVWPFAPVAGGLTVDLSVYTRLPTARSGRPPRINDMVHANGRLFALVEEDGLIYDITDGRSPSLWFDVAAAIRAATGRRLDTSNRFHGGLRSAAFHPDFLANGKLYTSLMEQRPASRAGHVYLSDVTGGIAADSVLVEWTVDPRSMVVDPASYREVFRVGVPEYDHPIKQIEFDPSARPGDADRGLLYVGHGDGSVASLTARGGRRNDALGKVLRIDPLASGGRPYRVPPSNPFVGDAAMLDEVYSIGHRNPHHLSFAEDGTLLVADVGRDNVDEIDLVLPGRDYGWAEREGAYVQRPSGGVSSGIARLPADDAANGFTYPVAVYGHEGRPGESFVTRAIVGGPVMRSASGGEPFYLYTEFARTGDILYSRLRDLRAAVTRGEPAALSVARTRRAAIRLDVDGDPATPPVPQASLRAIVGFDPRYDGSNRVDDRFGTDAAGNLYVMNKRNGLIYRARISGTP